jgi:uncharacterized protein YkwD
MSSIKYGILACFVFAAIFSGVAQAQTTRHQRQQQSLQPEAQQLLARANAERVSQGLQPLEWDAALALAAREHCLLMVADGSISHRYKGELSLADRAGHSGAHFSVIEENVAVGPDADTIHEGWMHSPGHRSNLLSPEVNRVGIAVVAGRNGLYAVADYAKAVEALTSAQVESRIARLLQAKGVSIMQDHATARTACTQNSGIPHTGTGKQPSFIMRWQDTDLTHLPQSLSEHLATKRYREAEVGSCTARVAEGDFTAYRVAVLLY